MINDIPKTMASLKAYDAPKHIFLPRGMITPEEQTLLYLLAKNCYAGKGYIVDAGAFCGASSYAFCAGLEDNTKQFSRNKRVWSYDLFRTADGYTKQYVQNNFYSYYDRQGQFKFKKHEVRTGDSFEEIYKFQTQRYSEYINCNPGSILDYNWQDANIEILFIDVAKTLEIQKHLFRQFLPALSPESGILIQQDFHHAYHPYIHVAMEYLSPFFEITHSKVSASRVYRLLKPIPNDVMQTVIQHDFTNDKSYELMQSCISNSPKNEQSLLKICGARLLVEQEMHEQAKHAIREFVDEYSSSPGFDTYLIPTMKSAVGTFAAKELALILDA